MIKSCAFSIHNQCNLTPLTHLRRRERERLTASVITKSTTLWSSNLEVLLLVPRNTNGETIRSPAPLDVLGGLYLKLWIPPIPNRGAIANVHETDDRIDSYICGWHTVTRILTVHVHTCTQHNTHTSTHACTHARAHTHTHTHNHLQCSHHYPLRSDEKDYPFIATPHLMLSHYNAYCNSIYQVSIHPRPTLASWMNFEITTGCSRDTATALLRKLCRSSSEYATFIAAPLST